MAEGDALLGLGKVFTMLFVTLGPIGPFLQLTRHADDSMLRQIAVRACVLGVIAVVVGEGNRRLFESLGATSFVEGGQTMNPATSDLVAAV